MGEKRLEMLKRNRNSFLTPLVVEVMPSGKTFIVAQQFTCRWGKTKITVPVPVGFETDFAIVVSSPTLVTRKTALLDPMSMNIIVQGGSFSVANDALAW